MDSRSQAPINYTDPMWTGLLKLITGVTLAIAILFFVGVSAAQYFFRQLATPPPRPTFASDNPSPEAAEPSPPAAESATETVASPAPVEPPPEPSPEPVVEPVPVPATDPNAYDARVTQPIGLVIRQGPGQDTSQVGGIAYNEQLTVLETSADGEWLRVRLASGVEGWIKSGNTEQVN